MRPDTKVVKDRLVKLGFPSPSVKYSEIRKCGSIFGEIWIKSKSKDKQDEVDWCINNFNDKVKKQLAEVGCRIGISRVTGDPFHVFHDDFGALSDYLGNEEIGIFYVQSKSKT